MGGGVLYVMNTASSGKAVFKPYQPNQPTFLPPSLDELISPDHLVRVVSEAIDRMDISPLLAEYPGGGSSAYHPKMLLKVVVFGYTQQIYSARRLAKAVREQIPFMWLAGGNRPDFRTINRFRSSRLKGTIEEVFAAVLELCWEAGLLCGEEIFVDGTKIEANANKRTVIWKKSSERYRRLRQEKIRALLADIDRINEEEDRRYAGSDLEEMGEASTLTSEKVEAMVKALDERLRAKGEATTDEEEAKSKVVRRALKRIEKEELPKLKKFERQEEISGDRNSYSRTDEDATFMRLKEDPMQGGELKAAYNVQLSTQDQLVVGFSVHQRPGDSPLLIEHLEKVKQQRGSLPSAVVADAGYGSEENYAYLESEGVEAFVKYNTFDREQSKKYRDDPFRTSNWPYDKESDTYICPDGRRLFYHKPDWYRSETGYLSPRRVYQADDCSGCVFHAQCMPRGTTRKRFEVGEPIQRYRARARQLLDSERGKILRARRSIEVESVFGQIKGSRGYRRFKLRGLEKVRVELGLLALAHNLIKIWGRTR